MIIKFLPLVFLLLSCTKEVKYTKDQLVDMIKQHDSKATVVLPKTINDGIQCSDYSEGCLSGHTINILNLEMIAVEFEFEEQAHFAARKYNGLYLHNWLLDDVIGEPKLERFFMENLKAKKP